LRRATQKRWRARRPTTPPPRTTCRRCSWLVAGVQALTRLWRAGLLTRMRGCRSRTVWACVTHGALCVTLGHHDRWAHGRLPLCLHRRCAACQPSPLLVRGTCSRHAGQAGCVCCPCCPAATDTRSWTARASSLPRRHTEAGHTLPGCKHAAPCHYQSQARCPHSTPPPIRYATLPSQTPCRAVTQPQQTSTF
jgi:hypothetical protein